MVKYGDRRPAGGTNLGRRARVGSHKDAMVDVLIITFNEELNLPHTLESVRDWANRVFVVDSGSTDRTMEIARSYGATVIERKWEGYSAQKNWALENVPFESTWILILDADEAVTPELREEIRQVVSRPP